MAHLWRLPWAGRRDKFNPNSGRLEEERGFFPSPSRRASWRRILARRCLCLKRRPCPTMCVRICLGPEDAESSFCQCGISTPHPGQRLVGMGKLEPVMVSCPNSWQMCDPQGSLNLWVTTRRAPRWEYRVRGLRWPLAGRWFCWCGREGNVSPALILPVWGPGPFQGQTVATAMLRRCRVGKAMRGGMAVGMENPFQEAAGGWTWAETPSPLRVPLDFTYKIEIQRENFLEFETVTIVH